MALVAASCSHSGTALPRPAPPGTGEKTSVARSGALRALASACSRRDPGPAHSSAKQRPRAVRPSADPAHRLGMLAVGQQLRAARIVLHLQLPIPAGTGFHDGERWTPQLGREFLTERCGLGSPGFVEFEIDRYLGRPGQAVTYKLGEKVWLEAREAARRRDGAAFDLKQFHRRALDLGPMGLDLLRAELTRRD
jgi:hypothetical protein